jgi:hypothetical protein
MVSLMLVAVGWHCRYCFVAALVLPLPLPLPGRSCAATAASGADAYVYVFDFLVTSRWQCRERKFMCPTADVGGCGSTVL